MNYTIAQDSNGLSDKLLKTSINIMGMASNAIDKFQSLAPIKATTNSDFWQRNKLGDRLPAILMVSVASLMATNSLAGNLSPELLNDFLTHGHSDELTKAFNSHIALEQTTLTPITYPEDGVLVNTQINPLDPNSSFSSIVGSTEAISKLDLDFAKAQAFITENSDKVIEELSDDELTAIIDLNKEKSLALEQFKTQRDIYSSSRDSFIELLKSTLPIDNLASTDISNMNLEEFDRILSADIPSSVATANELTMLRESLATALSESRLATEQWLTYKEYGHKIQAQTINALLDDPESVLNKSLVKFLDEKDFSENSHFHDNSFYDPNAQVITISTDQLERIQSEHFTDIAQSQLLQDHPNILKDFIFYHELSHSHLVDHHGEVHNTNQNVVDLLAIDGLTGGASGQYSENFADISSLMLMATDPTYSTEEISILADAVSNWREANASYDLKHYSAPTVQNFKEIFEAFPESFANLDRASIPEVAEQVLAHTLDKNLSESSIKDLAENFILHPHGGYAFDGSQNRDYMQAERSYK